MDTIIKATGVKKTYSSGVFRKNFTQALKGIDLEVFRGEIFGVLGPNGAGKTTFLNIVMGIIFADAGEILINGRNITKGLAMEDKMHMNMCSGNPNFPWCMSVKEVAKFYSMLYNLKKDVFEKRYDKLISVLEIKKYENTRFDELSSGNKQKLSLLKSLINEPDILLLDEPTTGMDPDISIKMREFIKMIHKELGMTTLLTTHYMKEAEDMCDRIAFIKEGSIIALGTKEELIEMTKTTNMEETFIELVSKQD